MGDEITAFIVKIVPAWHYFDIQADEVTDVNGWEQLVTSVRHNTGDIIPRVFNYAHGMWCSAPPTLRSHEQENRLEHDVVIDLL